MAKHQQPAMRMIMSAGERVRAVRTLFSDGMTAETLPPCYRDVLKRCGIEYDERHVWD